MSKRGVSSLCDYYACNFFKAVNNSGDDGRGIWTSSCSEVSSLLDYCACSWGHASVETMDGGIWTSSCSEVYSFVDYCACIWGNAVLGMKDGAIWTLLR